MKLPMICVVLLGAGCEAPAALIIEGAGSGSGRVLVWEPADQGLPTCEIIAGATRQACRHDFRLTTDSRPLYLQAEPLAGSRFGAMTGCTPGDKPSCTALLEARRDKVVTVTFLDEAAGDQNRLVNPGFEQEPLVAGLPTAPGNWRGDLGRRVAALGGVAPAEGSSMFQFTASGPKGPGATFVSSEQWQMVDLAPFASAVDAGKLELSASARFARVAGDPATIDTRFDVRVLVYSGAMADFPKAYAMPMGALLAERTAQVLTTTAGTWTDGSVVLTLPAGARYAVLSLYAFENVRDDATDPEFDGHFVDDARLVLRVLP